MKRFTLPLLTLFVVCSLNGCGSSEPKLLDSKISAEDQKLANELADEYNSEEYAKAIAAENQPTK